MQNSFQYEVPTSDDGRITPFERMKQHQGVWPFRCNKLTACDKIRHQSCGCEEEGDTEKAAIVYYLKDTGQSPPPRPVMGNSL